MVKVFFYYPSTTIGGTELIITNYCDELNKNGIDAYIIVDFINDIYSNLIPQSSKEKIIQLAEFNKNKKSGLIILPMPLVYEYEVLKKFKGQKIIAWTLHPGTALYPILPFIKNNFKKFFLKLFLIKIHKKYSLWFLDIACYNNVKNILNLKMTPIFQPIIVNIGKRRNYFELKEIDYINIALVGRLVSPKLYHLKSLLDYLYYSSKSLNKINLHVVGDGAQYEEFIDFVSKFPNVKFHGSLTNDSLIDFLEKNIDITFAMGKSALDAAIAGNAVIMVDFGEPLESDNNGGIYFNYIYDFKSSHLGQLYSIDNLKSRNSFDLENLLKDNELLSQEKLKCKEFALENFDFDNEKVKTLIYNLKNANFKLNEFNLKLIIFFNIIQKIISKLILTNNAFKDRIKHYLLTSKK
jgi:hypothetical protein